MCKRFFAEVDRVKAAMRDFFLSASGTLGLAPAFVHGLPGETRVFAHAQIEPERLDRIIRGVWVMRGRHFGWAALAIVVGLAVAGLWGRYFCRSSTSEAAPQTGEAYPAV